MKWRVIIEMDSREDAELLAALVAELRPLALFHDSAVAVEPVWPRAAEVPVVHEAVLSDVVPVRDCA